MKIKLDLQFKYLKDIITVANISGDVELSFIGETLGKSLVKKKLVKELGKNGLSGTVTIDGEPFQLEQNKKKKS
jgi:hypothetical protein